MDPEDVEQCMREETHTKWLQEYEAGSCTKSGMEDQLQRLIKLVIDSSMVVTKEIREFNHEEFGVVRDQLDSIVGIVSRQTSIGPMMQGIPLISTEPQARNVQVPPTKINAGNEKVH